MTVKEVLQLVATFLGKEQLLESAYFTGSEEEISASDQKELDLLLGCLNLVISEIATEYMHINKTKQISLFGGEIKITDIDTNIFEITKMTDENASNVKFKLYGDTLCADCKKANVFYTVFAEKTTLDGNYENFSNKLPMRVLAYGVAMEYCFISSLFDDATIWESRYKNSLFVVSRKNSEKVMPKRRWL